MRFPAPEVLLRHLCPSLTMVLTLVCVSELAGGPIKTRIAKAYLRESDLVNQAEELASLTTSR